MNHALVRRMYATHLLILVRAASSITRADSRRMPRRGCTRMVAFAPIWQGATPRGVSYLGESSLEGRFELLNIWVNGWPSNMRVAVAWKRINAARHRQCMG
jgi:hypothetical protein